MRVHEFNQNYYKNIESVSFRGKRLKFFAKRRLIISLSQDFSAIFQVIQFHTNTHSFNKGHKPSCFWCTIRFALASSSHRVDTNAQTVAAFNGTLLSFPLIYKSLLYGFTCKCCIDNISNHFSFIRAMFLLRFSVLLAERNMVFEMFNWICSKRMKLDTIFRIQRVIFIDTSDIHIDFCTLFVPAIFNFACCVSKWCILCCVIVLLFSNLPQIFNVYAESFIGKYNRRLKSSLENVIRCHVFDTLKWMHGSP